MRCPFSFGPDTSLCSSTKSWTPPNSNAPISFTSGPMQARYQSFMASACDDPTRMLPRFSADIVVPLLW